MYIPPPPSSAALRYVYLGHCANHRRFAGSGAKQETVGWLNGIAHDHG